MYFLTVVVAVDAKLNSNGESAGKDLKTIENKIVLRLKRILTEHFAEETDVDEVNVIWATFNLLVLLIRDNDNYNVLSALKYRY